MMTAPVVKFQMLLRELFQFDCADMDFGIYRIMNHRRDVIERFIAQDLPKSVANEAEAYHGTPLGKTNMDLKAKAAGGRSREALEARTASWRLAKTTCGRHRTHHRGGHTPQS